MLAEDLNLAAVPICGGVELSYRPGQKVTQLPDANHLLVTELPALEWDCFLWNLPKPLEMRLGEDPWPQEDFATSDRPGGSADLRTSFVVRTPFLVEQMHAAGATTIAYMHDPPRLWYYPLYVANGWIDVYGVLENGYCGIANRGTEADFWQSLDREGTNGNFGVWYRFLNCGYRLPASAGTDNIGMGVGVWKGYNRVYAKLDGPLTVENWLSALKQGRTFVTNRPLLFVTVDGKEPGSELAVKSADRSLNVDIHAVSATPISRIDILHQGRVLKQIDVDPPAADIRRNEKITVPKSGWLAVRCLGRGENPNLSPAFAFAHTSPFYVLVDGRPIRSPEDARYFHDQFSAFVKRSLPRVKNEQIRRILESKCRDALAKYAAQAEIAGTLTMTCMSRWTWRTNAVQVALQPTSTRSPVATAPDRPGGRMATLSVRRPSFSSACVTNTRSLETMGVELPCSGSGASPGDVFGFARTPKCTGSTSHVGDRTRALAPPPNGRQLEHHLLNTGGRVLVKRHLSNGSLTSVRPLHGYDGPSRHFLQKVGPGT